MTRNYRDRPRSMQLVLHSTFKIRIDGVGPFNEPKFYLSLLILVMSFPAITAIAIAALALLKTRSWHHVVYVRGGLCAVALLAVVNLLHHGLSIAKCLELIFPFVFLPYFFLFKRVPCCMVSQKLFGCPPLQSGNKSKFRRSGSTTSHTLLRRTTQQVELILCTTCRQQDGAFGF